MTIRAFRVYYYRLPLRQAITLGGRRLSKREGLLLCLEDEAGREGWGEAAPLPGFSKESLAEARVHLIAAGRGLLGRDVAASGHLNEPFLWPPSVGFAVEQAVSELWAVRENSTPARFWAENPASCISLGALLTAAERDDPVVMERLARAGYPAVKVKVGRGDPRDEAESVRRLAQTLGVPLRLDANRAWDLPAALDFSRRVADVPIAYLEEPLSQTTALPAFLEQSPLPVALDETIQALTPDELGRFEGVRAVVLKPTLLGGGTVIRRWIDAARMLGMTPVFSAAYESGLGMRGLIALAAALGDPAVPAGLDTYRSLATDLLDPGLDLEAPEVTVASLFGKPVRPVERHLLLLAHGNYG